MAVSLADIADVLVMINDTPAQEIEQELIFLIDFDGFSAEVTMCLSPGEEEGEPEILEIDFWLKDSNGNSLMFGQDIDLELLKTCNSLQERSRWGKIQIQEDEVFGVEIVFWCAIDVTPNDILHAKTCSSESLFLRTMQRLSTEFIEIGNILLAYQRGEVKTSKEFELLMMPHQGEA